MPTLDRKNLPMKTLKDFRRFVGNVRIMYTNAIATELREIGREDSDYAQDLRRELANFNKRAKQVEDAVGDDVAGDTELTGDALARALHMLQLGY